MLTETLDSQGCDAIEADLIDPSSTVSPHSEMIAYETLWGIRNETLTTISDKFRRDKLLPSALLKSHQDLFEVDAVQKNVIEFLERLLTRAKFSVSVHGLFQYPERLQSAKHPIELFYYRGDIGLLDSRCISVVGARKCSREGALRAKKLVKGLVDAGFTIVSGLAAGIDTIAHTTAIEVGGNTIGVIGTPIDQNYPKENSKLQETIGSAYLLVSQVPFYRYAHEPFRNHRFYFPQRNETMSALSEATVIVEASDTSGALTQARACLHQNRKLFILKSCIENPRITWPKAYLAKGAIQVNDLSDITNVLGGPREPVEARCIS